MSDPSPVNTPVKTPLLLFALLITGSSYCTTQRIMPLYLVTKVFRNKMLNIECANSKVLCRMWGVAPDKGQY